MATSFVRADRPGYGLYIHVPFCRTLCPYCHFARTNRHDAELRRRTVRAIVAEMELRRRRCATLAAGRRPLASVYVGGGTPSVLEPELMGELLDGITGGIARAADVEITCEANPESFSPALATAWREAGINRISLGVQSLHDESLRWLGRSCDAQAARDAMAVAVGHFGRVAADWILGPQLDPRRLRDELAEAVGAGISHVSLYVLQVHDGTPLAEAIAAGRLAAPAIDRIESVYLTAAEKLAELGLHQYEVANFARPGCESRHNRRYWQRLPYLGLGPGAHGFWGRRRYANSASVSSYLRAVESESLPERMTEILDRNARRLERLILPLRTTDGIDLERIPVGALPLERGVDEGLWRVAGGRLVLTTRGFLRIDDIECALAEALADMDGPPARPAG